MSLVLMCGHKGDVVANQKKWGIGHMVGHVHVWSCIDRVGVET